MATQFIRNINRRYVQGISDEPVQLLKPIYGYAHEPLLPLEQACEPLLSIVPRLAPHIWIAKENSKNSVDDLTQDESAAVRLYTMEWDAAEDELYPSLYSHLNKTLKLTDRTKLRPWSRYLKLLLTALAKIPLQSPQIVWRGVRKDLSADYLPGTEKIWWAFSSCTTSLNVLESDLYLGKTGTRTLFSIETFNARTVRAHSDFTTEDEMLLLPGSFFEVKSQLNPAPDLYIIHLTQKRPPHDLLEPPFIGATITPSEDTRFTKSNTLLVQATKQRSKWYKRKPLILFIILIMISAVLLISLTVALIKRSQHASLTLSVSSLPSNSTILPPTIADVYYAFDGDTLDLYRRYDGTYCGGVLMYVSGYVATGQALLFNQTVESLIEVARPFDLTGLSYTIEAFVMVQQHSLVGNIVEFSSDIFLGFDQGYLQMIWNRESAIQSNSLFPVNEWRHVAFVYDIETRQATIYLDGIPDVSTLDATRSSNVDNLTMYIGSGFQGILDHLSVNLNRKSDAIIFWDANVLAYYPFDADDKWLFDHGPNGFNATSQDTQFVIGRLREGLKFNHTTSFYESTGFTILDQPGREFTLALWIRVEISSGIVLTVASASACLVTLGIRHSDNRLFVFLPNSTITNENVTIIGPVIPFDQWIHVAFTWSTNNHAQLYTSISNPHKQHNAVKLNNKLVLPMTVTLGTYRDRLNCISENVLNSSQPFMGSVDEFYIFSREMTSADFIKLTSI